jgi:hypothetical protein
MIIEGLNINMFQFFILINSSIDGQAHGPAPTWNAEKVASVCHPEQSEGSKQCT